MFRQLLGSGDACNLLQPGLECPFVKGQSTEQTHIVACSRPRFEATPSSRGTEHDAGIDLQKPLPSPKNAEVSITWGLVHRSRFNGLRKTLWSVSPWTRIHIDEEAPKAK